MKQFNKSLKTLIMLLLISLTLLSITYADNTPEPKTYEYYGIINGNGHISTIYLKLPNTNTWQSYTIKADYIGYECKLIVIDKPLAKTNYKQIKVLNFKDINSQDINQVNNCINDFNEFISYYNK